MRFVFLLLVILFTGPALAQGWTTYANARYGATADIPPGFLALGPEAANSDGQTFRSQQGTSIVIVYGAEVPDGNFEAYVDSTAKNLGDFEGWTVEGKTVTPDWAEISATGGRQQLRLRVIVSCNGRQAVTVKYQALGFDNSVWSHLARSLKAGPARSCGS